MEELINYNDLKDHLDKIEPLFYPALLGELTAVFGEWLGWHRDIEDDWYECSYDYNSSTAGWREALVAAARKTNQDWIINYYDSLDWMNSDHLDGMIEAKLSKLTREDHNAYYKWLITQNKM